MAAACSYFPWTREAITKDQNWFLSIVHAFPIWRKKNHLSVKIYFLFWSWVNIITINVISFVYVCACVCSCVCVFMCVCNVSVKVRGWHWVFSSISILFIVQTGSLSNPHVHPLGYIASQHAPRDPPVSDLGLLL